MAQVEDLDFGSLLRRFRREVELTQEELAERAGMSVRGLGDLERGASQAPYRATVFQLADALQLSPPDRAVLLAASRRRSRTISRPPSRLASSVPHPPTPLIGREKEVVELQELLMQGVLRLVTLTGPGGVGKTRLALEVAARLQDGSLGAVTVVHLAPLRDSSLVAPTIARTLGLREAADGSVMESLVAYLQGEKALLVLDNLEHLLEAGEAIAELLASCPDLRLLTTSREALHLRGEQEYPVFPLTTPDPLYAPPPDGLARYPAIELFVQRARAVQPDFRLDDGNAATVAEICYALDGLPLAIELAAARIKLLPPHALVQRLSHGLTLLAGGAKDQPERQQTLRRTIDWSYSLLSRRDRTLFGRLSVFVGGCTLEAAEAVCNREGDLDLLEGLASLVDKSLVRQRGEEEPRFRMLETIREYAEEKLEESGESERFRYYHAQYFLSLAEAEPKQSGPDQFMWLDRLEGERDNLRGALRTALRTDDVELGVRLAGALWPFWWAHAHVAEAQTWLDEILKRSESADVSPTARAFVLLAAGSLVAVRSDHDRSLTLVRQALALAQESGDDRLAATALLAIGETERGRGNYRLVEPLLDESLTMYRRLGDQPGVCAVLSTRATLARYQGDYGLAASLFQEALVLGRTIGDVRRVADTLARLGNMACERGRPADSLPLLEEALALYREVEDTFGVADVLYRWGETVASMGDFAGAVELYEESLALFQSLGTNYGVAYVLLDQAEAAIGLGDLRQARALAKQSGERFADIDDRRCIAMVLVLLGDVAREQGDYQQARALYKESVTLNWELNIRPGISQCLERMARLAAGEGQTGRAARLHGAGEALREAMDAAIPPAERVVYERSISAVREEMGTQLFAAMEAEGRAMGEKQVLAYALEDSA